MISAPKLLKALVPWQTSKDETAAAAAAAAAAAVSSSTFGLYVLQIVVLRQSAVVLTALGYWLLYSVGSLLGRLLCNHDRA